jgi:leader peptidase (prepilin peptidase) / N-methyltransferase
MPSLLLFAPAPLLVLIAFEDLRDRRIRNSYLGAAAVSVAAVAVVLMATFEQSVLLRAPAGAALAAAPLAVPWLLRPSGVGGGDVKLAVVVGSLVGLVHPYLALLVVAAGLLLTLTVVVLGKRRSAPFAPAFVLSTLAVLAVGVLW